MRLRRTSNQQTRLKIKESLRTNLTSRLLTTMAKTFKKKRITKRIRVQEEKQGAGQATDTQFIDITQKNRKFKKKKLEVPYKKVSELPKSKREKLKKEFSYLAEYIFLSVNQKKQYFRKKNLDYRRQMKSLNKKSALKVQFQPKISVIGYNQKQNPIEIRRSERKQEKIMKKKRIKKPQESRRQKLITLRGPLIELK